MSNQKASPTQIQWETLDWAAIEKRVWRIQRRIYKATLFNQTKKIQFLQYTLIHSLDAKLLAVRLVTSLNKGQRTPGVDKKLYLTPEKKMALANKLHLSNTALPIRQVMIPKPGKIEMRPLGIPVMEDRAKQALVKLAIEPQWEAKFEPNSYGFRPGRGCHDAIERIFMSLTNTRRETKKHKYILDADLKGCFNNISHDHILNCINDSPKEILTQIKAWLKAGVITGFPEVKDYSLIPSTEMGTPQGGVISPILCNIALHGLENHLKQWILTIPHKGIAKRDQLNSITFVRYADDFVVIHKEESVVRAAKEEIKNWLAKTSELNFNEEKTTIKHSPQGFTFLGFNIIHVTKDSKTKVLITASKESVNRLSQKVHDICKQGKSLNSYHLIERLRPITLGWANYFCFAEWKDTANSTNHKIFQQSLRPWVFRRKAKNKGRQWVKEKYFPSNRCWTYQGREYKDNWILYGEIMVKNVKKSNFLPHLQWVTSKKHVKVIGTRSPFDGDLFYWGLRSNKYGDFSNSEKILLKKQNSKCQICGISFQIGDQIETDHKTPKVNGGTDEYSNLQVLHKTCHERKTVLENKARNSAD